MKIETLDSFTRAYLGACLWSTTGDDGEPLDSEYSLENFAPEAVQRAAADCARFQTENAEALSAANIRNSDDTPSRAGFLFWLNRNGHGSGFWDEKTHNDPAGEREACEKLADAASKFKSCDAYVDSDKIYFP